MNSELNQDKLSDLSRKSCRVRGRESFFDLDIPKREEYGSMNFGGCLKFDPAQLFLITILGISKFLIFFKKFEILIKKWILFNLSLKF